MRSFVVLLALLAACGSDPVAQPTSDAGTDAADAGADAKVTFPTLPYPAGPYGIGFGDVMPDIKVQGYRLSPTERDSRKLPFEDIALSEVRSNPACKCVLVVWTSAGRGCPPCVQIGQTLATIIAKSPSICPLEVLAFNYDSFSLEGGSLLDQPATRADLDAATQESRLPFPVGIPTGSIAAAGMRAIPFVPGILVMNAQDMRVKEMVQGGGGPGGVESRVRQACEGPPATAVETLATTSFAVKPRLLTAKANRAFLATEEKGILAANTNAGASSLSPLVSDLPSGTKVSSFATDASSLYWTTSSAPYEIARVAFSGGARQVLSTSASEYTSIAIDGTKIWFTKSDGVIGTIPIDGGPETSFATGETKPTSIIVDPLHVYFIAGDSIIKRERASSARTVRATPATFAKPSDGIPGAVPIAIAQSGENLLVRAKVEVISGQIGAESAILPKGDGPATSFASLDGPSTFAGPDVYAATRETKSAWALIERVPIIFGDQKSVMTLGQHDVSTIAVDGEWAYWTNRPLVNGSSGDEIVLRRVKLR